MKVRLEIDQNLTEPEIILRAPDSGDDRASLLKSAISRAVEYQAKIRLELDDRDFFVTPDEVLFFDAAEGKTYAHTATKLYRTRAKLYELETILPGQFLRVSKSAILNTTQVLSLRRNLAGSSLIGFRASPKRLTVSRRYLKKLETKLNERSLKW